MLQNVAAVWALTSWTENIAYLAGGARFPLVRALRIFVNDIVTLSCSSDASVSALGSPVAVGLAYRMLGVMRLP